MLEFKGITLKDAKEPTLYLWEIDINGNWVTNAPKYYFINNISTENKDLYPVL